MVDLRRTERSGIDKAAPTTLTEEQLRLALEASKAGVWDWNIATDAVTWTDRLYDFHGLPRGSFGGRASDFLQLVLPEDRPTVQRALEAALHENREYRVEFRTVRPGGEIRHLATSARLLRDASGRPERMIGVTFDVTEQKVAEEEQRRLLQATETARLESEEATLVRERLISMVGHDLRTPLSAITLGSAALLLRNPGPDERRILDRIQSSAGRMARMIADILDFAASRRSGGLSVTPQPTDLGELARKVADETETAHPGARVTVRVSAPVTAAVDPDRVSQVLSNLLTNAHQYGDGSPIDLQVANANQGIELSVHNRGVPIPAESLPGLFEPFRRGRTARGSQNLGLGLYICREIVRAHAGRLDVRSDEQGTTFVVHLPAG